ncbi:MAG: hypothetical protein LBS27_11400, partial [Bifidobacteriaceae bacterium]|nr:hypothetical protein [Bifidobacteriaceae bacterium]
MVPSETAGRKGRQPDGTSLTREVKVGRLFTQTGFDEDGGPILDRGSTSYIAHFDTSEQFAAKLAAEALARDFHHAPRLAVLADGARWIWNLADKLWPDAIQIVDYYHASKHVNDLADLLKPACPDPAAVRQTLKGHLAAG